MSFTDYLFLPAFVISLILYFAMPKKSRWIVLLVVSVLFYFSWSIVLFPFIIVASLIAYFAALKMESKYTKGAATANNKQTELGTKGQQEIIKRKNKRILLAAISLILFILVYIKVQQYLVEIPLFAGIIESISAVYESCVVFISEIPVVSLFVSVIERETGMLSLLYPLGISYYTLSLLGYLADVYWKKEKAEKNYFKLLLFVIYFPKILEGPISKHRNIGIQLNEGHEFDYKRVCFGLQRVVWGYFKKLIIADRLIILINEVFENAVLHMGSELLIAAIFGAMQLYCDFSGCMDIALGISECFGITLEENFKQPFASRSAAEFWRRWHITLGTWFKDYVFMPLAISPRLMKISSFLRKKLGKRAGKIFLSVIPLAVVWLLTGLWHGTGANYLIWGVYWGLLIILSNVFEHEIRKLTAKLKIDTASPGFHFFQKSRTFWLFVISRFITLPETLEGTWYSIQSIFTNFAPWKLVDGSLYKLGIDRPQFLVTILAIAFVGFVGSKHEKGIHIREWIAARPIVIRWLIYYGAIFAVLIFGAYGPGYDAGSFVYMQY